MGWTISWQEFMTYLDGFMTVSEDIGDGWFWQGDKTIPGGAFIVKRENHHLHDQVDSAEQGDIDDSSLQGEDDPSTAPVCQTPTECTWEYHILYSCSYAAPVLYFNAFTLDGRLLPVEILWRGQGTERLALQQMRWEALSQQEHPVLRRPFYQLHPCKTAEFLKNHQGISSNPIVTWLSSMGPAIGLHLKNKYSSLVNKETKL